MDLSSAGPVVMDTLMKACSQDPTVLRPAEQQLSEWETQPGFYTILASIFTNHSVDANVRWLAVLYFKNGVDRHWRRNMSTSLSEEEKHLLKQKLIGQFNEPITQVAVQLAVLIAKIARLDCPKQWPELLPVLLETVKCDDTFIQQRALLTLHHVVKSLASKRLSTDRNVFVEFTGNVFGFVLSLWDRHVNQVLQSLQQSPGSAQTLVYVDQAILTLKVLRKLSVFGVKSFEKGDAPSQFVSLVFDRIQQFMRAKKDMLEPRELPLRREKTVTLLTKVLLDIQEHHPAAFLQFAQLSLHLCVNFNFSEETRELLYERFTVNLFNLMRGILRCEEYRPAKIIEDTKSPVALEAFNIKMNFFTSETLREIAYGLIGRYFLLTSSDLQSWGNDPEDYLSDEGGDSWKFSLRPCTENLYLTLIKEFRRELTPFMVELVQQQLSETNPEDMDSVLKKDAVYNAIGLASFDLYDEIDFDSWFQSHLVPELQNKHSNFRVLRRRVIWLVGCWIGVKFSPDLQPVLYQVILPLLQQDEDLIVRMEAALTLKIAVDDFEFKTEHFLPFLETSFGLLFQLLKDVDECETKMQILHVLSFIIERMRVEIRPHAGALLQYLPLLWQESSDHNLLRCAILCTLTALVQGLGASCVGLFEFLIPVIQLSTDVSQDPHVYLCEDGLELWLTTLLSVSVMTPELLMVYENMKSLLDLGSDTLMTCLKIIKAYILLAPEDFLQKYSDCLVKALSTLVMDLRTEGVVMVYKVMELVFQVKPKEGPEIFSCMLPPMIRSFLNSQDYPMVTAMYISVFSRLLLQSEEVFWQLLNLMSQESGSDTSQVLGTFLDTWLDRLDNIIHDDRKKISAMALIRLLKCNSSIVLERLAGIINASVEVMHNICKMDPESDLEQQMDALVIGSVDNFPEDQNESEHDRRKRQLAKHDPVHTIGLCSFVGSHLGALQQQVGDDVFQQVMGVVDPDVSAQLQRFLRHKPRPSGTEMRPTSWIM